MSPVDRLVEIAEVGPVKLPDDSEPVGTGPVGTPGNGEPVGTGPTVIPGTNGLAGTRPVGTTGTNRPVGGTTVFDWLGVDSQVLPNVLDTLVEFQKT